jgi:hypothetical protein
VAVLEGRDELRDWTRLAAAAPKQLGVALFCRQCWLAAAMGAFLPGPNAISAALSAAAILQPLSKQAAPAALAGGRRRRRQLDGRGRHQQLNAQVLLRSDMPFGCHATGFIDAPYGGPRAHETARKQPDSPRSNTAVRRRSPASGGPPPAARARSARQRHRGKTRRRAGPRRCRACCRSAGGSADATRA